MRPSSQYLLTGGVSSIHGFAFDEERVELGQHHARFAFVVAELEAKVGSLGQPCSVEIRHLSLPHDRLVDAPVESRNTSGLAKIVLNDRA